MKRCLIILLFVGCANNGPIVTTGSGSKTLYWINCPQIDTAGNSTYNQSSGDCTSGTPGTFNYCGSNNGVCDDGKSLIQTTSSQIYESCNNSTVEGKTWRVPTLAELQEFYATYGGNKFYWSSSACWNDPSSSVRCTTNDSAFVLKDNGQVLVSWKVNTHYLRCVSDK